MCSSDLEILASIDKMCLMSSKGACPSLIIRRVHRGLLSSVGSLTSGFVVLRGSTAGPIRWVCGGLDCVGSKGLLLLVVYVLVRRFSFGNGTQARRSIMSSLHLQSSYHFAQMFDERIEVFSPFNGAWCD